MTMPITLIDRNGPPEAMICPAVICDMCGEPIDVKSQQRMGFRGSEAPGMEEAPGIANGWVLYLSHHDDTGRPVIDCQHFVHGGDCDHRLKRVCPGHHASRSVDNFLGQLLHNFKRPFGTNDEQDLELGPVEYVAPAPSRWRVQFRSSAGGRVLRVTRASDIKPRAPTS